MINNPLQIQIDRVIGHLIMIIEGQAWYGKSLSQLLEGKGDLSKEANQIIAHMLAWREFTLDKLEGRSGNIKINSEEDWPTDKSFNSETCLAAFRKSNERLILALKAFDQNLLLKRIEGEKYHYQFLIEGIVHHDLYHLGQIALYLKPVSK